MSRRNLTLSVAVLLLGGLLIAAARLPVPYFVYSPGPVTDTLGNIPASDTTTGRTGGPVIQISGARTQPTNGHLYLTTVEQDPGTCGAHLGLLTAIKAWFSSTEAVVPHQVQCPPGKSSQAVQQQGVDEMAQSQSDAVYAALTELGYKPTGMAVFVQTVSPGPAASVLQPNDEVLTANGQRITRPRQLVNLVQAVHPGDPMSLVIERAGARKTVNVRTAAGPSGKARLGISIASRPTWGTLNVTIGIDPNVIGGPSAGTALALGIIDKLTPGGLTGGRTIAGTGTISRTGEVGPIGGIQQKVAAAVKAGATVFFAPASECADAKAAAPSSLMLIRVTTLHEAVQALEAIKSGSQAFPHC
jgi:PDZ domain-containing protein